MAKKVSFQTVMAMKEDEFFDFVVANGHAEQLKKIGSRKTEQKVYPKVLKPRRPLTAAERKDAKKVAAYEANPNKLTYQADKTQKPTIKVKEITFFELKSAYCEEVLKLEKKQPEKKETFRDRMKNL